MSILKSLPDIEEEREILARARASREGMDELIRRYDVLVKVNAHKLKRRGRMNDSWKPDLYQEGYLGLMRAAKTYDDSFGTKFSTWAIYCIEGQIRNVIGKNRNHENAVSLSTLLNDELEFEGLFASESTGSDFDQSLTEESLSIDLKKIASKREIDLVRIRYDLEI